LPKIDVIFSSKLFVGALLVINTENHSAVISYQDGLAEKEDLHEVEKKFICLVAMAI